MEDGHPQQRLERTLIIFSLNTKTAVHSLVTYDKTSPANFAVFAGQVAACPESAGRGRGNPLLLGGLSLARNLSSNAPSATPNGGVQQEQQQHHILGQGNIGDVFGVSASALGVVQDPLVASTEGNGIAMSDGKGEAAAASLGAAASQPSHTVVEHPPAPGWEYPPVPNGCEPKFAIIRLGNTQYKVQ